MCIVPTTLEARDSGTPDADGQDQIVQDSVQAYADPAALDQGGYVSNVQRIQDLYEAFAQGDIPTVMGAMDPKIEWREAEGNPYAPDGKPWVGPDQILQELFIRLGTEWDAFTVHPKEFYDAGDTVIVEGRYTGTYKETGESADTQMCHIFKLRDGKVTSFQQYLDTAKMQSVMKRHQT